MRGGVGGGGGVGEFHHSLDLDKIYGVVRMLLGSGCFNGFCDTCCMC